MNSRKFLFAPLLVVAVLSGCLSKGDLVKRHSIQHVKEQPLVAEGAELNAKFQSDLPDQLTVENLTQWYLLNSANLNALRKKLSTLQASAEYSGSLPNPIFSATMESVGFSGKSSGDAEYVTGFTQKIPLGGRLSRSQEISKAEAQQLKFEVEAELLEVHRRIRTAFANCLFSTAELEVEEEILEIAESILKIAQSRKEGGQITQGELTLAEFEHSKAKLQLLKVRSDNRKAISHLEGELQARLSPDAKFEGELETVIALPKLFTLNKKLSESPKLKASFSKTQKLRALKLREQASAIPDLDVGLFYRRIEQQSKNAFDVGVALEVPLFNSNKFRVKRAEAQFWESHAELSALTQSLNIELSKVYWQLDHKLKEVEIYKKELLPQSETISESFQKRYRAGAISLEQSILVQRDIRKTRLDYLEVLHQIALLWAQLRSLIEI